MAKRRHKVLVVAVLALAVAAAIMGYISYLLVWNSDVSVESETVFEVSPGDTSADVTANLAEAGHVSVPGLLRIILRLNGSDRNLKAGKYRISPGSKVKDIVSDLAAGAAIPDNIFVLIREGARVSEIVKSFAEDITPQISLDDFTMRQEYRRFEFLAGLKEGESLTGYLFPDTYAFARNSSSQEIIVKLLSNTALKLASIGIKSADFMSADGLDIHEIITLASIVQKESGVDEMAKIAGVFMNRLQHGRRLESDATINYILGSSKLIPSGKDIRADSPYNTYLNKGLPPGPIGNPGLIAIIAVLNPERHSYFFFLHTPTGRIILSNTFNEHLEARSIYWE